MHDNNYPESEGTRICKIFKLNVMETAYIIVKFCNKRYENSCIDYI